MKHLFPEEHQMTRALSVEWQEEVVEQLKAMQDVFESKGKARDETSCVWQRLPFPDGMLTIIEQKGERMQPLLAKFNPYCESDLCPVAWDKVIEEARDIATYWVFFVAVATMLKRRALIAQRMKRGESHA